MTDKAILVTDDVAIVAYPAHEELTVEGKPPDAGCGGRFDLGGAGRAWRCALHTESIAGDPFGRDRRT